MTAHTTAAKRDEARDVISRMKRQEATTYRRRLPISVDRHWRQSIVEWMYSVVDTCGLQRDAVSVASYYLDATSISSRKDYQLCAMTALQLALKLYDSVSIKWSSLVRLGRGAFSEQEIEQMEKHMLSSLEWHLHPPTSLCFLRQYLLLLPESVDANSRYCIEEVSRFTFEFSSCIGRLAQHPPSHLAFAGMCVALQHVDSTVAAEIHSCMEEYAGLTLHDITAVWNDLQRSLAHNISLHELLVSIDAQCTPQTLSSVESLPFTKNIVPLGSSPRQVSG